MSVQTLENILGDLNPIEDVWSHLDRKLKTAKVTCIRGLKRFLNKAWESLSWDIISEYTAPAAC